MSMTARNPNEDQRAAGSLQPDCSAPSRLMNVVKILVRTSAAEMLEDLLTEKDVTFCRCEISEAKHFREAVSIAEEEIQRIYETGPVQLVIVAYQLGEQK